MSELLALGISHKTAPVAVRERLALTTREAERLLRELTARRRGPRGRRDLDVQPHRGLPRRERPGAGRGRACSSRLANRAGIRPTELAERRLHAAQLRRRAPALPRRERPGVDDRRRGRGAGPGPARLRARAGRRHDRADDQPPVPAPRCRPASACARETGDRRGRAPACRPSRSSSRARPSATSPSAASSIIGAGETSELTAQALADAGRRDDLRRQPPRRPRARRSPSASAGSVGSLDALPERLLEADIVVASTSSPHPLIGAEELELVMRRARGRPLRAHRHRGPARHRAGVRRHRRRHALRHRRPAGRRGAQPRGPREARRASAEAVVEEEIQRFARWMAQLDVAADDRRAARARRRRSSTRSWPRTPGAGRARRRATSRASRRSRAP